MPFMEFRFPNLRKRHNNHIKQENHIYFDVAYLYLIVLESHLHAHTCRTSLHKVNQTHNKLSGLRVSNPVISPRWANSTEQKYLKKKKNSVVFSLSANYTDRAIATGQRS
jgi:hypothetical protein